MRAIDLEKDIYNFATKLGFNPSKVNVDGITDIVTNDINGFKVYLSFKLDDFSDDGVSTEKTYEYIKKLDNLSEEIAKHLEDILSDADVYSVFAEPDMDIYEIEIEVETPDARW